MAVLLKRLGTEFRANAATPGNQSYQTVAPLTSGGFAMAWIAESGDGNGYGIAAQRFNADGAKVGGEFQVNTVVLRNQLQPSITGLPSGGFVVTWTDDSVVGSSDIRGRIFDSAGTALGADFVVNTTTAFHQDTSNVFALAGGGFVVSWNDIGDTSNLNTAYNVRAQIFDSSGARVGQEFPLNLSLPGVQARPHGVALGTGGFVVVWNYVNNGEIDVRGQLFDSGGNRVGGEFHVPANGVGGNADVAALPNGGFVVSWEGGEPGSTTYRARAQMFDADGSKIGPEVTASNLENTISTVNVTGLASGGFLVSWEDNQSATPSTRAQMFDAEGNRLGSQFQLNLAAKTGGYSDLATLSSGRVVATWNYGSPFDVNGQVFRAPLIGTPLVDTLDGGAEDDAIAGLASDDILSGGGGNDTIDGGAGDDVLAGGAGADTLDGGPGVDTADFSGEPGPVAVNIHSSLFIFPGGHPNASRLLGPGEALDSFGNYETLVGIENLILTAGNDQALGSDGANRIEGGAGNDLIVGMGGDDDLIGAAGDDDLTGGDGGDSLEGGYDTDFLAGEGGNDMIDGGAGDDFILGGAGGDTMRGDDGDDTLRGEDGDDTLVGGGGYDLLRGGSGADSFDGGDNEGGSDPTDGFGDRVSFFEARATQGVVADLRSGIISNDGFGNSETMTGIESLGADTAYADILYGNDNRNSLLIAGGDSAYGFGGDDHVEAGAAPAVVDGGAGTDLLQLRSDSGFLLPDANGDGTAEPSPGMTSGWNVDLAAGTLRDGYGHVGSVTGIENLVGSELGDELRGNAGANKISGGDGGDLIRLQDGGADTASGGDGGDAIYFGMAFTIADVADGGSGADVVILQGNYSLTLSAANLTEIEALSLQSGAVAFWGDTADNRYDYSLTTLDGFVPAGVQTIINGQSLLAGEDLTFDGSAETNGQFLIFAGHGVDTLKGGANGDVFFFEGTRWSSSDTVDGGGGADVLVISAGSGLSHYEFLGSSFVNIEAISVSNRFTSDPSQKPSYELVLANANVTAGQSLIVNGNSLESDQTISIDGSAVQAGSLTLYGGAGNDALKGGGGIDLLYGADGADDLTGGGGADVFRYDSVSESNGAAADLILDFATGVDKIDLSRIDADTHAAGDQAFTWIGASAFGATGASSAGQLRAFEDDGQWRVEGDTNGDGSADFVLFFQPGTAAPVQGDFVL